MTGTDGAAARLERMTEMRKQAPNGLSNASDPEKMGVTDVWLAQVFGFDIRVTREKLRWCPVKRVIRRGKTQQTTFYDLKEAARFLVVPALSTQDFMRELKRGQLPPALQQSVWDALLKRQTWEERAGQLWRTEKVREVLGSTFQSIKFTTQLWAETVERQVELSPEQRALIVKMSDLLLKDVYESLVQNSADRATGPQLSEMDDYVGEFDPVKSVIATVESPEDDIDYTIASLV